MDAGSCDNREGFKGKGTFVPRDSDATKIAFKAIDNCQVLLLDATAPLFRGLGGLQRSCWQARHLIEAESILVFPVSYLTKVPT